MKNEELAMKKSQAMHTPNYELSMESIDGQT